MLNEHLFTATLNVEVSSQVCNKTHVESDILFHTSLLEQAGYNEDFGWQLQWLSNARAWSCDLELDKGPWTEPPSIGRKGSSEASDTDNSTGAQGRWWRPFPGFQSILWQKDLWPNKAINARHAPWTYPRWLTGTRDPILSTECVLKLQ